MSLKGRPRPPPSQPVPSALFVTNAIWQQGKLAPCHPARLPQPGGPRASGQAQQPQDRQAPSQLAAPLGRRLGPAAPAPLTCPPLVPSPHVCLSGATSLLLHLLLAVTHL